MLGLRHPYSFINILRSQTFTYSVTEEFLTSKTVKLLNPRAHKIKTDQVTINLPASSIAGLDDEAVLALLSRGFWGGWCFTIERLFMKYGGWRVLPGRDTGFESRKTDKIIWNYSEIPKTAVLPVRTVLFGSFKLVDAHLKSDSNSHPSYSYLDFAFGSVTAHFTGCHRFSIHRNVQKDDGNSGVIGGVGEGGVFGGEEYVQIRLEHFRCNPRKNVDSWAEWIPWIHYWYAKVLLADGVRSVLRR